MIRSEQPQIYAISNEWLNKKLILDEKPKEVMDILDEEHEALLTTVPTVGLTDEQVTERLARFGPNGSLFPNR